MSATKKLLADTVMEATSVVLGNLCGRWRDESQYEDWNEYVAVMRKVVDAIDGVKFVSMSKRPFGFTWDGADGFRRITKIQRNSVVTLRSPTRIYWQGK